MNGWELRGKTYHDVGASQVGDGGGWWGGHFGGITAVLICSLKRL